MKDPVKTLSACTSVLSSDLAPACCLCKPVKKTALSPHPEFLHAFCNTLLSLFAPYSFQQCSLLLPTLFSSLLCSEGLSCLICSGLSLQWGGCSPCAGMWQASGSPEEEKLPAPASTFWRKHNTAACTSKVCLLFCPCPPKSNHSQLNSQCFV